MENKKMIYPLYAGGGGGTTVIPNAEIPSGVTPTELENLQIGDGYYEIPEAPTIPTPTASDNGKMLGVVDGAYNLVEGGGGDTHLYIHNVVMNSTGRYGVQDTITFTLYTTDSEPYTLTNIKQKTVGCINNSSAGGKYWVAGGKVLLSDGSTFAKASHIYVTGSSSFSVSYWSDTAQTYGGVSPSWSAVYDNVIQIF